MITIITMAMIMIIIMAMTIDCLKEVCWCESNLFTSNIYISFSGRVREKRTHSSPRFYGLCSHSERNRLDDCLKKKGHNELAENHLVCTRNKIVISCFYLISCDHVDSNNAVYNYTCSKIYHQRSYVAKCCGVLGCWLGSSYYPGTIIFESTL